MLTFTELRELLGITQPQLTKWITAGMPHELDGRRKLFDEEAVAAWLIENGHAEEVAEESAQSVGQICTTRREAAAALGVSLRYFSEWLNEPGFPGFSGSPGRQDGYFPISEIEAWRANHPKFGQTGSGNDSRDRINVARAKKLELEYERELESLISVDVVERFIVRTLSAAKAILETLDEEVIALMPESIDAKTRTKIRRKVGDKVDQIQSTLAELIEGDEDEEDVDDE